MKTIWNTRRIVARLPGGLVAWHMVRVLPDGNAYMYWATYSPRNRQAAAYALHLARHRFRQYLARVVQQ